MNKLNKALAKINLAWMCWKTLRMDTMMSEWSWQSIYLYDEVKIAKKKEPGITLTNKSEVSSNRGWQYRL